MNELDISSISSIFNSGSIVVKKGHFKKNIIKVRNNKQTTWVDKYRPKRLKDIIGNDELKNMLNESIKNGNLPHLLFHGNAGTGKTSTVMALINQLYEPHKIESNVLELNASDENGINVVRDKIIRFANIVVSNSNYNNSFPSFKIIILDEADSMTSEAQTALKKVMESTCDITRFVFICNYENKIIDAIKSRCADFRFNPIPDDLMIDKLKEIAKNENLKLKDNVFKIITKICEGDGRRSINTLQNIKYIPNSKSKIITKNDVYDITSYIDTSYISKYWDTITKKKVNNIVELTYYITNTGYPMDYILNSIKDKIVEEKEKDLNSIKKCKILIYIGKIERMIYAGSNNYIHLLSLFSYINSVYKDLVVNEPKIF
jgi:replication factor C subunit 2/4